MSKNGLFIAMLGILTLSGAQNAQGKAQVSVADEITSTSLLMNAAQYDNAPIFSSLEHSQSIEFGSQLSMLPRRNDEVMGQEKKDGSKRTMLPEIGFSRILFQGPVDVFGKVWAGYLELDHIPVGSLQNYTIGQWNRGVSVQVEADHENLRSFYTAFYHYTEGGIRGGFIDENLQSESSFSCHQTGVGAGLKHLPTNLQGSVQVYKREMSARMQFDVNGAAIDAQKLDAFRYAAQASLSYQFAPSWSAQYAQFAIPGKIILPRMGVTWRSRI